MGAILSKWVPPIQNRRVGTYVLISSRAWFTFDNLFIGYLSI